MTLAMDISDRSKFHTIETGGTKLVDGLDTVCLGTNCADD